MLANIWDSWFKVYFKLPIRRTACAQHVRRLFQACAFWFKKFTWQHLMSQRNAQTLIRMRLHCLGHAHCAWFYIKLDFLWRDSFYLHNPINKRAVSIELFDFLSNVNLNTNLCNKLENKTSAWTLLSLFKCNISLLYIRMNFCEF